jgi:hypothetical protein
MGHGNNLRVDRAKGRLVRALPLGFVARYQIAPGLQKIFCDWEK